MQVLSGGIWRMNPKGARLSRWSLTAASRAFSAASEAATAAAATSTASDALQSYLKLREQGERPSLSICLEAIRACCSLKELQIGKRIHSEVAGQKGEIDNVLVGNTLINMYATCGDMREAHDVFEKMSQRNLESSDNLVLGYAQNGDGRTLEAFVRSGEQGCPPSRGSMLGALWGCAALADKERGKVVNGRRIKVDCLASAKGLHSQLTGFGDDVALLNTLIDLYARCGSMEDARAVFDGMKQRDVVTWNSILRGYAYNAQEETALQLFERMQGDDSLKPDAVTFVVVLRACFRLCEKEEGAKKNGMLSKAKEIQSQATKHGVAEEVSVANALIELYARCGSMADARETFDSAPRRDTASWNIMLTGYLENGDAEAAFDMYQRMKDDGCARNSATYFRALKACAALAAGSLESGQQVHWDIVDSQLQGDVVLASCLTKLYAKHGRMEEARQVFEWVPRPGLVAWKAMIAGYSRQGKHQQAIDVFERMLKAKVKPDGECLVLLLEACSDGGYAAEGMSYMMRMKQFGVEPRQEHFARLFSMLGRLKLLDEAPELLLEGMRMQPDATLWMQLLNACRQWPSARAGRRAFEAIVRMDRNNRAAYSTMADILRSCGMEDEARRVEAQAAVTTRGRSSSSSSSAKHPQREQINDKLAEIASRMPEGSKFANMAEDPACGHSERLALACALINTAPRTPIRIVKNLRICDDCHAFFKLVSKMEERTLICRDANRFHSFADGECTCKDFW